jgi:hypothetical protein
LGRIGEDGSMKEQITLAMMKRKVIANGFTPSEGCWEDEQKIIAFSVESYGPSHFGHPKFMIEYRKYSGELLKENNPYSLKILPHA